MIEIQPVSRPVDCSVALPGSKSLTNRALLIAALADGRCTLQRALFSDDTRYMAGGLRQLGLAVTASEAEEVFEIVGTGGAIPVREADLYIGNAGTAARFLTSYAALGHGRYRIDGVARMRERPIQPLLDALIGLGVRAGSELGSGCPPVIVEAAGVRGGATRLSGALSSQYLTSLLLIGPYARQGIEVEIAGELVSRPYIDMTIRMMRDFGVAVKRDGDTWFRVEGGQRYAAREYEIEPDASAASYFFAAAAVTGGHVRVEGLGASSLQGDVGFVDVLEQMGCAVLRHAEAIEVWGPQECLRGVEVDMNGISDTAQTLATIAPFAADPVRITGIMHVRGKETDRIRAVTTELRRLGARVEEHEDGMTIHPSKLRGAEIETYDDHRMAMSFAIPGLKVPGIRVKHPECVNKTFPGFFQKFGALAGA